MIIFNKKQKEINVPKGLGNVSVAITSGNTDTINEEKVREIVRDAASETLADSKAYTDSAVTEASQSTLRSAQQYADTQAENAVESANTYADSAITAASDVIWLNGYTAPWETRQEDIDALFEKVSAEYHTTQGTYPRFKIMVRVGGRGIALPFNIYAIDYDASWTNLERIRIQYTGMDLGSDSRNRIIVYQIYLHNGQPITQNDCYINYINFS